MSAGNYNTEAFVTSVRRRGLLPATSDGVAFPTDADILALANEEMAAMLVPWLLNAREGHFLTNATTPLVANQAAYTLPQRAVAADVAYITLLDDTGNPMWPGLVETDLEIAADFPYQNAVYGQPTRFYWEGNSVVLVPAPATSSTGLGGLGIFYPQRVNQIIASTAVTVITARAQSGSNFTVSYAALPTTGTTFASGLVYECVHANPSFEIVALGTASSVTSTTATFPGTLPTGINVGDVLCLQDTANFPTNVPADVYLGMFSQWIAYKIAEIRRDKPGMEALATGFKAAEKVAREYKGRRDKLSHRKVASASARHGRRPLYFVR